MIREIIVVFICLVGGLIPIQAKLTPDLARDILTEMYQKMGNFQVAQPTILISQDETHIATFDPSSNEIVIEQKAVNVCESFGNQSENALAFLIGHELTHCYQQVSWVTNYLSFNFTMGSNTEKERMADIRGAFAARLAGYDTRLVVETLIEKLYEEYNLMGKTLVGYPPLEERKQTATYVTEQADELWHIYQTATYTTILEKYELAIQNYLYLSNYYSGREVYNNLGLLYAQLAMTVSGKNYDSLLYPLELDTETRILNARDKGQLNLPELEIRQEFLNKADDYFLLAQKADPNYFQAYLNRLCIKNLSGQEQEVIEEYQSGGIESFLKKNQASVRERGSIRLAVAIAFAISSQDKASHMSTAKSLFDELITHSDPQVQKLARFNSEVLEGNSDRRGQSVRCALASPSNPAFDNISLMDYLQKPTKSLDKDRDAEFYWEQLDLATVYLAKWLGESYFLKRVNTPGIAAPGNIRVGYRAQVLLQQADKQSHQIIPSSQGYFIHFPACNVIFRVDQKGKIAEWVSYL
ncbi:MAG: hypothetical protein AAF587_22605 [Bacteroidota bacterium]